MTTIFCRLCSTCMSRSSSSCSSGSTCLDRKSKYSVERSLGSLEILLRLAGGGPSFIVLALLSGAGEPLCEVCCDAGGEGRYATLAREPARWCARDAETGGIVNSGGGLMDRAELRVEDEMVGEGGAEESGEEATDVSAEEKSRMMSKAGSDMMEEGRRVRRSEIGFATAVAWSLRHAQSVQQLDSIATLATIARVNLQMRRRGEVRTALQGG